MYACEPEGMATYVEPFLGSGAVLCGSPQHNVEVVGDVNEYVINFFKVMQEQPARLLDSILNNIQRMEEGQAEFFHQIRRSPPTSADHPMYSGTVADLRLDWAVWYYLINKYSFNGIVRFNEKGECNSTYCTTTRGRGVYDADWFNRVRDRIQGVTFVNTDYSDLLRYADGGYLEWYAPVPDPEKTWVVLDPPYYEVFTKYNKISFTVEDHIRLRDHLAAGTYKWLLTINDVPGVRELYAGFNFLEHEIFYSCSQTAAGRGNNKELIITNYDVDTCKLSQSFFPVLVPFSSSMSELYLNTGD